MWKDEHIADSITVHAIDFMKKNKDENFFLYLCTNDIHVPRFPAERFRGLSGMGYRGDAILQFDWTVGQVMKTLKELGLEDDTIVILTSDNGPVLDDGYQDMAVEMLGNHRPGGPLRGGKYSLFEAGNTVPFIVSLPERMRSDVKVSASLVSQVDFIASMAAMLEVEVPEGMAQDSQDQLSVWMGDTLQGRDYVVAMASNRTLSIRDAKWKYIGPNPGPAIVPWGTEIETGNSLQPQLYNLETDIGETCNLAEDNPEIAKHLKEELDDIVRFEQQY